jgi:hypothetical protein
MDEAYVFRSLARRILVGQRSVLRHRVLAAVLSETEIGGLASDMFGRILIGIWVLVWVSIFLFILSPVKPARIPLFILRLLGPFVFVLAVTSMVYGLIWLYQEGMKRARRIK